ncbi:hypothetical protein [Methanolacinia petrolearia]|nr:hypothetical protein [Methanolacinia petrolearia]
MGKDKSPSKNSPPPVTAKPVSPGTVKVKNSAQVPKGRKLG